MKKQSYEKATLEVIEFKAEKGFARTPNNPVASTDAYTDGGNLNWNSGTSGSSSNNDVWDF